MRFEADTFKALPLFQEANKTVTVLQLQYEYKSMLQYWDKKVAGDLVILHLLQVDVS
jgi:hypothetical protein